jgi:hypothetical protein
MPVPSTPSRFIGGVSTYAKRNLLCDYPVVTTDYQNNHNEDFTPYVAANYTVTQTNGTAVGFPWNGGAIRLNTTGTTGADKIMLATPQLGYPLQPGNRTWFDLRVAFPTSGSTDVNAYFGLFDNVDPTAASNGIYFIKPTGGTAVNLIIRKATVNTTFQNVADLIKPSGVFGDVNSVNAVLTFTPSGGNYSAPVIANPGLGFRVAPIIVATGATGANAIITSQLGGGNSLVSPPQIGPTNIPYGSIAQVIIMNPGNGAYTTTLAEVDPLINLDFFYDGKGSFWAGINGRQVMSIIGSPTALGTIPVTAGGTYNVATTGPSYTATGTTLATTLYTGLAIPAGDPYNIFPTVPLQIAFGFQNTTANPRAFYIEEINVGGEVN